MVPFARARNSAQTATAGAGGRHRRRPLLLLTLMLTPLLILATGFVESRPSPVLEGTPASGSSGFVSDDFNGCSLDTGLWTLVDPVGDATVSTNGTQVLLSIPADVNHDVWTPSNRAPRLMQPIADTDLELEVKFESVPTERYQLQGLLIEADASNFLRFDFYSTGSQTRIFAARFVNGSPSIITNTTLSGSGSELYLRVTRSGDQWTQAYSFDGSNWTTVVSGYTHALAVSSAGVFVGNAGFSPAFTGVIDYVFNTASPIVPEDGSQQERTLTTSVVGDGSIERDPDQQTFGCGESVEVTANAAPGWSFSGWSGDLSGSTNPATVVMDHNRSVTATFVETGTTTYDLTVQTTGSGSVSISPDQTTFNEGETATLTANPATGYTFDGWSGDLSGSANPAPLLMDGDKNVTATFSADVTPPVISSVQVTPGATSALVTWTTDEPATSTVAFGPSSAYELGTAGDSALVTSHSVTLPGLNPEQLYHMQVRSTDGAGNEATRPDQTFTTLSATGGPTISLFYGTDQQSGQLGRPQIWFNVLGNVADVDGVSSLTYSLNGGATRTLAIGPDNRRLWAAGDFNIDLSLAELNDGPNEVRINAVDGLGNPSTKVVTVNHTSGTQWPLPTSIDWSTVSDIQDVAQVVDGDWTVTADGLRISGVGYDRLVAIGDVGWTDYEVLVPITIHEVDYAGTGLQSGEPGLGVLVRWQGHTDTPVVCSQPKCGWMPNGNIGWWRFYAPNDVRLEWFQPKVAQQFIPEIETTYLFRLRVEELAPGAGGRYSLKAWKASEAEPSAWNIVANEWSNDLLSGSILLLAHHVDATFGDVSIIPLQGTPTHELTVNTAGNGSVAVNPDQTTFTEGATATLTATAAAGWTFSGWSGDLSGNDNPATVVMTADRNITATFVDSGGVTYDLTVNTAGSGSVAVSPDQTTFNDGETATLTATAAAGWTFSGWSGDLTGSTNPADVVMDADRVITATFVADTTAPEISGITITPSSSSATVAWTTNEPATSTVAYGPTSAYELGTVDDPTLRTSHSVTLTGLTADSTYHLQVRSSDGGGNEAVSADQAFTTTSPGSGSLVSDDFNSCTVNSGLWTLFDPRGDATLSVNGTQLLLSVPAGISHDVWSSNQAPRLMQTITDTDFEVEVKFESLPTERYQLQGLLIEADANNYLRFDFHSTGSQTKIFAARIVNGSPGAIANTTISASGNALYMRVNRTGDAWTQSYSVDGTNWTTTLSGYVHSLNVASAGIFVGNAGFNPSHTAVVDYLFNSASPISPEDALQPGHTLTSNVVGNGSVSTNPDPLPCDGPVDVTATADPGWTFSGWSGDLSGNANPATVVLDGDKNITATFVAGGSGPVISGINVTPSSNGAVVSWTTDQPATSTVAYGPTTAYELGTVDDGTLKTSHSVALTGLTSNSTYHLQVRSTNGNGDETASADQTFTTTGGGGGTSFVSDDFNSCTINGGLWTLINPGGDGTLSANGTQMMLSVPAGSSHDVWSSNQAPRVMQAMADTDFELEVKFDSIPDARYQLQGLLIEADANNYMRFDFHSNGPQLRIFVARIANGSPSAISNTTVVGSGDGLYMRVNRTGDTWTQSYSVDGVNWTTTLSGYVHSLNVTSAGAFVGNAGFNPAHTGVIDYIFNTATPIVPEDATVPNCG